MNHLRALTATLVATGLSLALLSGCSIKLGDGGGASSTTSAPTTATTGEPGKDDGALAAACQYWEENEPAAKAAFEDADVLAGTVLDPDDADAFARALGEDLEARVELFSELRSGYLLAARDSDPEVAAAARRAADGLAAYVDELVAIQDDLDSASGTAELSEIFVRIDAAHSSAGAEISDSLDTVGEAAEDEPACRGWLEATAG